MSKTDRFMTYFICFLIGIACGYVWRANHESKKWLLAHNNAQEQLLKDIRHEAGKGYNFHVQIGNTDIEFMPIANKKVRVRQ